MCVVRGVSWLALVVACCFSAGVFGGVLCCAVLAWRVVSCLALVIACCFAAGVCGGEPCRADGACWGGWGPHTPCARQIGPHPPQPTPPSRHGSLRCVWVRRQKCRLSFPHIPVQAHTGSHGRGVSRSDNLCSQRAEDGSPLVRAQSEAAPLQIRQTKSNSTGYPLAMFSRRTSRPTKALALWRPANRAGHGHNRRHVATHPHP